MIVRNPESKAQRAARYARKQLVAEKRNIERRIRLGIEKATDRARLKTITERQASWAK